MTQSADNATACPYCGRQLALVPNRWYGRAVLMCEQCGDFPEYSPRVPADAETSRHLPRVLLVDDSKEHLELYRSMLHGLASVATAQRGEDAIAAARTEAFDAVVLDVMMPGLDGWEVCRRLKADPATQRIPIVMLTCLDASDVPARARQLGASAVLMKPCPVERLMLVLTAAVRQRRAETS